MRQTAASHLVMSIAQFLVCGCSLQPQTPKRRVEPVYDQKTGKLQVLKYDSDGNGRTDTWTYLNGARVVRIEIDKNEDGNVDRWEYYGSTKHLEKIGFSSQNDGKEDGWVFSGPDGVTTRIERSTRRDGMVNRIEFYDHNLVARAEEDTDGDGRPDKWETYDGPRLTSVAFDTQHRGVPDRRISYRSDSTVRIEVDPIGDGHFVAAADPALDGSANVRSR